MNRNVSASMLIQMSSGRGIMNKRKDFLKLRRTLMGTEYVQEDDAVVAK